MQAANDLIDLVRLQIAIDGLIIQRGRISHRLKQKLSILEGFLNLDVRLGCATQLLLCVGCHILRTCSIANLLMRILRCFMGKLMRFDG